MAVPSPGSGMLSRSSGCQSRPADDGPASVELRVRDHGPGIPAELLAMSMTGTFRYAPDAPAEARPDFNVFSRYAANFPWRSHALWFMTQMLRWGQVDGSAKPDTIAKAVYRPEVFRAAANDLGLPYPEVDYKLEGVHQGGWALMSGEDTLEMGADLFMDGRRFDATRLQEYLEGFAISRAPAGCPSSDASGADEAQTA